MLSYNKQDLLLTTLGSLEKVLSGSLFEIIVVENGSTENNYEALLNSGYNIRVIRAERNLGFAGGCNLGAKYAKGDCLLFLNSDMLFGEDPLPQIKDFMKTNPSVAIIGYQLLNADGSLQPSYYRFPGLLMRFIQLSGLKKFLLKFIPKVRDVKESFFPADFVSGAFLLIRKPVFDKLGGFDENFFMYHEDADLCFRARKLGFKTFVYNGKNIFHLYENHEVSSNEFVLRHLNRGQIIFYRKHFGAIKLFLLILMSIIFYGIRYIYYRILKHNRKREAENLGIVLRLYLSALKGLNV